ncbi:MAG: S-adenosylmethionine decarboxylase [bacterium]|nr:S-adenosylmethionine decarboxylase [bacterium]
MKYQSPTRGNEISCVMHGIDEGILNDHKKLEEALLWALNKDRFTILEKASHVFKPNGFTLMVLLAESHVSIHTYPEHGSLYFGLYSCRGEDDGKQTYEIFKDALKPVSVDFIQRPIFVGKE